MITISLIRIYTWLIEIFIHTIHRSKTYVRLKVHHILCCKFICWSLIVHTITSLMTTIIKGLRSIDWLWGIISLLPNIGYIFCFILSEKLFRCNLQFFYFCQESFNFSLFFNIWIKSILYHTWCSINKILCNLIPIRSKLLIILYNSQIFIMCESSLGWRWLTWINLFVSIFTIFGSYLKVNKFLSYLFPVIACLLGIFC